MFDKLLHHKLLTDGLEGNGVITEQKVEGSKGQGFGGFYIGVTGHLTFDDGTVGEFSSKMLDTSKVGDLDVGTIVPVRYDADRKQVILDIPKLEAAKAAKKQEARDWLEHQKKEQIAAAEAKLHGQHAVATVPTVPANATPEQIKHALATLESMRNDGQLTHQEFEAAKRRIRGG